MRTKIRRSVLGALIAVPLALAQGTQSNAATVQFGVSGGAKSITGLSFMTETFDISFIHKPYDDAFLLGEVFSRDLMSAIVEVLNLKFVQSVEYSNSIVDVKTFYIPVSLDSFGINAARSQCSLPGHIPSASLLCKWNDPGVYTNVDQATWAVPVLVTTPLPSALPLFGTALGLLGFMGWRRRRKAVHNRL